MKNIFLTLLLLVFVTSVTAQRGRGQRIKVFKTAYITQELDLTAKEAEKFWPIYNQYEQKRHELKMYINRSESKEIKEKGGFDALSDKEAKSILNNLIQNEEELTKINKKLFYDLQKILSPQKILKLYRAEHDFNRKLLMEYRKKQMMEIKNNK